MKLSAFARRNPLVSYYLLTFAISWGAALAAISPFLIRRVPLTDLDGLFMFPAMLLGPPISGILHTRIVDGKEGLEALWRRMRRVRFGVWTWLAVLFVIPLAMLLVLESLRYAVSPVFAPSLFLIGFSFGVPAGLLEEIGWTGYALPKFLGTRTPFGAALIMGPVWGLWHAPVVDFLGAAYPHGNYWVPFFLAFVAIVSAVRVLLVWVYTRSESVPACQLMHISLTGTLVLLAPAPILAVQETAWYGVLAAVLWVVALVVGLHMTRRPPLAREVPTTPSAARS